MLDESPMLAHLNHSQFGLGQTTAPGNPHVYLNEEQANHPIVQKLNKARQISHLSNVAKGGVSPTSSALMESSELSRFGSGED